MIEIYLECKCFFDSIIAENYIVTYYIYIYIYIYIL